jgi:hypothetical protein
MFHMMNEARIGIGMAATMLGLAGYYASRWTTRRTAPGPARGRRRARTPAQRPPVRLIEHADIKRMLLAQKAYGEGALALLLYCARLVDEQHTGTPEAADEARLLLEVLTPIAKSWPSEWCLEANSLAIQIHGGYGYTRDFPVEQYWRDNRLNMIHEGTHGIQAMDLLGRKVLMEGAGAWRCWPAHQGHGAARRGRPTRCADANALEAACSMGSSHPAAWATGKPAEALANAVPYMQAFGHTVLAWMWLDVALASAGKNEAAPRRSGGRRAYFLPLRTAQDRRLAGVVERRDDDLRPIAEEAF